MVEGDGIEGLRLIWWGLLIRLKVRAWGGRWIESEGEVDRTESQGDWVL